MPKIERPMPPAPRRERKAELERRLRAGVAKQGVTLDRAKEVEIAAFINLAFPRDPFDDAERRRRLEAIPGQGYDLDDLDEAIRRASLEIPPGRGRKVAKADDVAARVGLPVAEVRQRLRVMLGLANMRPFAELPAFWRKERARIRKVTGQPVRVRSHTGWHPQDSTGQFAYLARVDEAVAAGEDLMAAMFRLYEEAPRCCAGCGVPLLPERFPGDPAGLRLRPDTRHCPDTPACRKASSRKKPSLTPPENVTLPRRASAKHSKK